MIPYPSLLCLPSMAKPSTHDRHTFPISNMEAAYKPNNNTSLFVVAYLYPGKWLSRAI